jgi:hypothetical protein
VLDEAELRRMGPRERARLARAIAAIDRPVSRVRPAAQRQRTIILASIIGCCFVLAAWIGVLAVTLPRYYRAGDWRGAWVGFDLALLVTFAVTAWAAWRRRQVLIICLVSCRRSSSSCRWPAWPSSAPVGSSGSRSGWSCWTEIRGRDSRCGGSPCLASIRRNCTASFRSSGPAPRRKTARCSTRRIRTPARSLTGECGQVRRGGRRSGIA